MSKVLFDLECADIIRKAIYGNEIDCADAYKHFLEDLGKLIADHFGGEFSTVGEPDWEDDSDEDYSFETRYSVHFHWDECVPEDGGVYKDYDTDVSIEEWKNEQP